MRPATIIDGMAPATPIPTPTPNVASGSAARSARRCVTTPNPRSSAMHAANASRGPSRDAEARADRREQAHAQHGDRREQPGRRGGQVEVAPDQRQAAARSRGSCWRSASEAMNSPATTATGTRGDADDTLPMLSDAGWPAAIGRRRPDGARRSICAPRLVSRFRQTGARIPPPRAASTRHAVVLRLGDHGSRVRTGGVARPSRDPRRRRSSARAPQRTPRRPARRDGTGSWTIGA